jgi:hypothetical protein
MDTFSSDNSRIMSTGITSQVVRGVQRNPVLKIPIPQLSKKQQQIKDISVSLLRILDKITLIK